MSEKDKIEEGTENNVTIDYSAMYDNLYQNVDKDIMKTLRQKAGQPPNPQMEAFLQAENAAVENANHADEAALEDLYHFQKASLYLKEIQSQESEEEFDATLTRLVGKHKEFFEDPDMTERKAIAAFSTVYKDLREDEVYQKAVAKVDKKIAGTSIAADLGKASYPQDAVEQILDDPVLSDALKTSKVYMTNVLGSTRDQFISTLRKSKGSVLGFLQNPHVKVALSSIAFTGAVASGGVLPLAMGGVKLVSSLADHEIVQKSFASISEKIQSAGDKLGIDTKPAIGLFTKAINKVNAVAKTKAFQYGALALGGVAIGGLALDSLPDVIPSANLEGIPDPSVATTTAADPSLATEATTTAAKAATEAVDKVATTATSTAEATADATSKVSDAATVDSSVVTAKPGDSLWKMAKEYYTEQTGESPSSQQIAAMITDTGITDPASLQVGQEVNFESDLSVYDPDVIGSVKADWLDNDVSGDAGATLAGGDVNLTGDSIKDAYIQEFMEKSGGGISQSGGVYQFDENFIVQFDDFQNADSFTDLIKPGMEFTDLNGDTHTLPSLEDMVASQVFPDGVPDHIDKGELLDIVNDTNADFDLSEQHSLDIFGITGTENVISNMGGQSFDVSGIDTNFAVTETEVSINHNGNSSNSYSLGQKVLKAVFGGEVPPLLDTESVLNQIADANPDLKDVLNSHGNDSGYVNIDVKVPDDLVKSLGGVEIKPEPVVEATAKVMESEATSRGFFNMDNFKDMFGGKTTPDNDLSS